jgi:mediator of RNA polymerase II transcription subunit 16
MILIEMAISIVGLIKWSLDLLVYILQELLSLHYSLLHTRHSTNTDSAPSLAWIQSQILSTHSPALLLLLSSLPRIFLRVLFRPLRYAYAHSSKGFANTALGNEQRGAFHKLLGVYNTTPVNHTSLAALEEFVVEIEGLVRKSYEDAGVAAGPQRQAVEREMFVHGTVPPSLLPAATAILTTKLDSLMDRIDAGKVHVHDVSWLGLTDDTRTRHFYDGHVIDVVRKMPLAPSGANGTGATKLRVCPRCGSVMEDIGGSGGGVGVHQPWVWQSHKVCVCSSSWASPEEEKVGR